MFFFLHVRKGRATRERGAAAFPREREVGAGRREKRAWVKGRRGFGLPKAIERERTKSISEKEISWTAIHDRKRGGLA
jgi:hypothetical protein